MKTNSYKLISMISRLFLISFTINFHYFRKISSSYFCQFLNDFFPIIHDSISLIKFLIRLHFFHNSVVRVTFLSTFLSWDWLTCQGESLSPLTIDSEWVRLTFTVVTALLVPGTLDVDTFFLAATLVPAIDVSCNQTLQEWLNC